MDCVAFYPLSKPVFQTMQLDIELVGLSIVCKNVLGSCTMTIWWLTSNLSLKIVKGCFILFWFTPQGKWPGPPVTKISNNYCKRKVHKFEVFTWTWGWVLTWGKLVTVGPDCSGYCMPLRPSRCFLVTNIWIELILYVNVTDLS